ncbi:MAG: IS1634 family transposase, partial [Armatimonadetes bacterium]|nr:IS1634 family transposase [Armatimonadota bacterium]
KHFRIEMTEESLRYERDEARISQEAALDGLYVIRTSVSPAELGADAAVRAYKRLSAVERAFRSFKAVDLKIQPIYHRLADRVRAHVLLCMLAYYVEWHMRRALAPLLFDDHAPPPAPQSPVASARRSAAAEAKARHKQLEDGTPVQSFQTLLKDLATLAKNRVRSKAADAGAFDMLTTPTPLQQRAFALLGVSPRLERV